MALAPLVAPEGRLVMATLRAKVAMAEQAASTATAAHPRALPEGLEEGREGLELRACHSHFSILTTTAVSAAAEVMQQTAQAEAVEVQEASAHFWMTVIPSSMPRCPAVWAGLEARASVRLTRVVGRAAAAVQLSSSEELGHLPLTRR